MRPIVVIGEAVADAFVEPGSVRPGALELSVRAGGSPANTAVALGRLDSPTRFLGRISAGVLGQSMLDHIAASRVDVSECVRTPAPATLAIAAVDAGGKATYDFYVEGTADRGWTAAELAARRPRDAACVHSGSLALVLAPGGPLVEEMLREARAWATISIDPNARPRLVAAATYRERLPGWLALADILRMSDEDLAYIAPELTLEQAFAAWHEAGVVLAVVTRGGEGAVASLAGARVEVPAAPVDLVDTVGAGDSFTAGLLDWLGRHGHLGGRLERLTPADLEAALTSAAAIAARTCSVRGADPPWANGC